MQKPASKRLSRCHAKRRVGDFRQVFVWLKGRIAAASIDSRNVFISLHSLFV